MPIFPLPSGDTSLAGGDLPVSEDADVLAEFPVPIRRSPVAPVRDTFVAGWAQGFRAYQVYSEQGAAQSDPMRATGDYLRSFAEEHVVVPLDGEDPESLRARIFAVPNIVTPEAILAGVTALLAPYTSGEIKLSELELDGLFIHDDGSSVWDSFIGSEPEYPDRYYADIPSLLPGGAVPSSGYPRSFLLRIPVLDLNDETVSFVIDDSDDGVFVMDEDKPNALFLFLNPKLSEELYLAVVRYVTAVKGQGFSFGVIVDPTL